ncbi:MAG: PAS domain S-box protein, partial [Pyrinomonadaceae bacterium]
YKLAHPGEVVPFLYRLRHRDGTYRYIEGTSVNLLEDPSVRGFVVNSLDVTERQLAAEALRHSEEKYRDIFDHATMGIYQSAPDGTILTANDTLARMLGYDTAGELLGLNLGDDIYCHPQEREALIAEHEGRGAASGLEVLWRRRDGAPVWVHLNARAAKDEAGRTLYFDGFAHDITERKRLEDQLRQAHKMEAVGRLAGGVAHDFNNLLTVIIGQSSLLMMRLPEGGEPRRKVEEIMAASERAAALTRQLLAFSRKQILQPRTIDLNAAVRDVERLLHGAVGGNVRLVLELAPRLGAVLADPSQIDQVLMNLAVNASHAMPGGGVLTIRTENVSISKEDVRLYSFMSPGGEFVCLSVSDTGEGMDAETRARIFEPFFTTKEVGKGTGMGLSTVYGIVKQSRGHIAVESEPGRGATFKIYLPRLEQSPETSATTGAREPQTQKAPPPLEASAGGETILLVEDDPLVREVAREVIESDGYHVLEADGPERALTLCREYEGVIALVLTDIVMPRMNGRELARWLKELRPEMRVVYMSGYVDDSLTRGGEASGEGPEQQQQQQRRSDAPLVRKPFEPDELLGELRRALGQDREH